jgi:hypothetical protein
VSRRDEKIRQDYGLFVKQYARKSKHINGYDPNDRCYDRKFKELIKKLSPEELHRILNEEPENNNKECD